MPEYPNLDPDGFFKGSVYRCGQCGYLHRNGPNGADHGGKEWVLSYTLGHRLVDRVTKTPSAVVTETPPVTESPVTETQDVTETRVGRPKKWASEAERIAAYRRQKA